MKTVIRRNVEKNIEDRMVEVFLKEGWNLLNIEDNSKGDKTKQKTLDDMTVPELKEVAKGMGIEGYSNLTKPELLKVIYDHEDNNK